MDPRRRGGFLQQERILNNWRRLVVAALSPSSARPGGGGDLPDYVPASLQTSNINTILQVANEIQHEDPNVSRILCEHAFRLSQNLDPNSEGRGVLQFKTALMSVIKGKLAKKEGGSFERRQDVATLRDFYYRYRERHQEDAYLDPYEVSDRPFRQKFFTTLRVLKDVITSLAQECGAEGLLTSEFKDEMEKDALQSEAFQPYNILPLESPKSTDTILNLPEVKAARKAINYPGLRFSSSSKGPQHEEFDDIFDALKFSFGFQRDNVRNQREHLVLLLANAQSQLTDGNEQDVTVDVDEAVINKVCNRIMGNYDNWCFYMRQNSAYAGEKDKRGKIALTSLYLCVWGEASNVRFLPECICYIFHNMAKEFQSMLGSKRIEQLVHYASGGEQSFLDTIITPIYNSLKTEATKSNGGKAGHSKWRNYDDFNEFFWSPACFQLGWPMGQQNVFFSKEEGQRRSQGKTSFVEHRTFLHLYHSFLRVWILLVLAFQGLTIIAFRQDFSLQTIKILLSLGVTYFGMKLVESILDVILMIGAYRRTRANAVTRIFVQLIFFASCAGGLFYLYLKMLFEGNSGSLYLRIYLLALGSYAAVQLVTSFLLHVPLLRKWSQASDRIRCIEALKWLFQERYYVGRGLFERPRDYLRYVIFWVAVLGAKFTFSYFLQIRPLVGATNSVVSYTGPIEYTWHDFVSKNNHNALTIFFLWAPVVLIYLLDITIWYTVFSAILGGILGARDRLGEIRSLEMLRNRFDTFPDAFVSNLHPPDSREIDLNKDPLIQRKNAHIFARFWNEIIYCLRDEDYINNRERDLLLMPSNKGKINLVQWPLFLLVSKVFLAIELAMEKKDSAEELWEKLNRDAYMSFAVTEVYESIKVLLSDLLYQEDMYWFQKVIQKVEEGIAGSSFFTYFEISNIQSVIKEVTGLTGLLAKNDYEDNDRGVRGALRDLYVAIYNFCIISSTEADWRNDHTPTFSRVRSKLSGEQKELVKRLHILLTVKETAANIPKNLEARRRLEFFTNSLFMNMPVPPRVRCMKSFSVYTPYYAETVMYSLDELRKENEDGISTHFYLKKIFPDEWTNFLERIDEKEAEFDDKFEAGYMPDELARKLRLWASYRGQTLARTVRGMMYYRRALMLQYCIEKRDFVEKRNNFTDRTAFEKDKYARAFADLKFTYVITCQIYGQQKQKKDLKADDILYLMNKNDGLRIAYIDVVEKDNEKFYYSKLVKSDGNNDQEIYSVKLPGNPIIGEGKPENQNHAVIFTRGEAMQTIDMNQDNYFEEALKMRNLLQEFEGAHGIRPPTILGVREHVFTGSVSSLAWFMSNQETSFVTLGQRVLARPLKVRMHYGHPDVFDRIFHLSRGGFSKASKLINISEDIYAGFNSTLRQGNVTHHEYIQVGKGRDVGLNQIAMFEAKVSSGNGEQSLSRDVYRLGQLLDFFRMLSFYVTSVGYYFCTMMTVLVVYVFLYGKAYLALSGVGQSFKTLALVTNNQALQSALDTQFLFQIGVFSAVPMIMGFILEQGVLKAIVSFITMQLQLCSIFFTFSLGTRTHYFGRTILHGGAKYRATGRGFVVQHIKFADNYRFYSRSHFVKALEIIMLLLVYLAYGYETSSLSYLLLSFSSWFLSISWLFAPYIFNPAGFEWQKTVEDFDDWTNWLLYRGGVGVKSNDSWEAWWEEEQEHIRSIRGRILETILSVRFFFFQYGVVYHLKAANGNTSLTVYGVSWLVLGGIILIFKVFSFNPKASVNFQMFLRLIQGTVFLMIIAGLVAIVALTSVTVGDVFASCLALIPTGWGILSIGIAWKNVVKQLGLYTSLRSIARFYDAAMGMVIFFPIAILSWFPFVSTFQTRLLFNQAFSRGLEISLILAGNKPNTQT